MMIYKLTKICIIIFPLLILISSCANESDQSYPAAFMWDEQLYLIEGPNYDSSKVGDQVGEISKQVSPFPQNHGESNVAGQGSDIFYVKDSRVKDVLVIFFDNNYHVAYKTDSFK